MRKCFHRYAIYFLIIVGLALLIIGCHTTSKVAEVENVQNSKDCRVIQHELGEICISLNPERVVVLDSNIALDPTIALGIKPVGFSSFYGRESVVFRDESFNLIKEAINVGPTEQPSLEKVLMLKPDLILSSKNQPYQLLSEIAPTIQMPSDFDQPGDESLFKQSLRYVAKIFSMEAKAEELINQYQQRIEDLQKRLREQLQPIEVSVIYYNLDLIYTPAKNYDAIADILIDLGLNSKLIPVSTYLNIESIYQFDTDILFIISDEHKPLSFYKQNPLFSRLKAVENDRLYLVPSEKWDTRGILGANQILDDLFNYLVDQP